jgi:hypothetical protein
MSKRPDNLKSTSTDMYVGIIANSDKLKKTEDRWEFKDGYDDDDDDELDEDATKYLSDHPQPDCDNDRNDDDSKTHKSKSDKNGTFRNNTTTPFSQHSEVPNHQTSPAQPQNKNINVGNQTINIKDPKLDKLLKQTAMRRLGELKECGVILSRNYTFDDSLDDMLDELRMHLDIRQKSGYVKWMGQMLVLLIKGAEFLIDANPTRFKINGLNKRIESDIGEYYMIFGEFYEKYHKPGEDMSPITKLLKKVIGEAAWMQMGHDDEQKKDKQNSTEEQNTDEYRKKAVESTAEKTKDKNTEKQEKKNKEVLDKEPKKAIDEFISREHNKAMKNTKDIQLLKDKELEAQRLRKRLDMENKNSKSFKEELLLSTEEHPNSQKQADNMITQEEYEHIKNSRYMNEQKQLEMIRKMAHDRSQKFNGKNVEMMKNLEQQNKHLDKILENVKSLDSENEESKQSNGKMTNKNTHEKIHNKKDPKDPNYNVNKNSAKLSDEDDDQSYSSVSFNPDLDNIMNKTNKKSSKVQKKTSSKKQPKKTKKETVKEISKEIDFEEFLDKEMEEEKSKLSREEITFGSSSGGNKKKKTSLPEISFGSSKKGSHPQISFSAK